MIISIYLIIDIKSRFVGDVPESYKVGKIGAEELYIRAGGIVASTTPKNSKLEVASKVSITNKA